MEPDYLQQAIDALAIIQSQTYLNNECYLEVIALASVAIAQRLQEGYSD